MNQTTHNSNGRNSRIEAIKIVAMLLIVINHVTQTLYTPTPLFASSYVLDVSKATTNTSNLILAWLAGSGSQGNAIFFVCSAWFLLDSKKVNYRKVLYMLSDVWIINIIILLVFKVGAWYQMPIKDVVKCFLPTTFQLNWYITCYILFYLIHVGLNIVIAKCSQKQLLFINIVTLSLYFGINYLHGGHFYANSLINFIVIYFAIAYIKLYMKDFCTSYKKNIVILLIGLIGFPLLILVTNYIGLNYKLPENGITRWGETISPFMLLIAVALLNFAKKREFVCRKINSISSVTLIIYIIHENYLLRSYVRPMIWMYIYCNFGYKYVILIDLLFSICLFLASTLLAYIYKLTLQKLVHLVSDKLFLLLKSWYEKLCIRLMRIS